MIELTFREGVKLRRALRLAFASRSALTQVVFDQMQEDLGALAVDADHGEAIIKLLVWAEVNNRTLDLIRGARVSKPADDLLNEFEVEYRAKRQMIGGIPGLPPKVLTPALRQQLVGAVMLIPTSETFDGRSAYLMGIPAAPSRNPNNAQVDLNTIFGQLDGLGKLDSGQWPLLLVIDNILPYVEDFPDIRNIIDHVKHALEQAYA